jgi:hypothetical protein
LYLALDIRWRANPSASGEYPDSHVAGAARIDPFIAGSSAMRHLPAAGQHLRLEFDRAEAGRACSPPPSEGNGEDDRRGRSNAGLCSPAELS